MSVCVGPERVLCIVAAGVHMHFLLSCDPLLLSSHLPNSIYSLLSISLPHSHILLIHVFNSSVVSYASLPSPTFLSGHSQSNPPSPHLSSLPASLSLHSSVNRFSLDLSSTKTRQCPVEYTHSRQGTTGYGSTSQEAASGSHGYPLLL